MESWLSEYTYRMLTVCVMVGNKKLSWVCVCAVCEHLNNLCFSSSIIQYLVTIVVHVAHDGVCFSVRVCQSSHGVCRHEGWIRAIRKICKTLLSCALFDMQKQSHKEKKKKSILKITKHWRDSILQHPLHSPTKNAHSHNHTVTQTVHTMPSFSSTFQSHRTACQAAFLFVQSCLWDWAPLPFSPSAAAQWLLFGGTGCSHITSHNDRLHKGTATTACSIYALHPIHPPIHHLFVGAMLCDRWSDSFLRRFRHSKWLQCEFTVLCKNT